MKEMAIGIVIGGVIASSFNSSVKHSSKSITQIGAEVHKLNKTKVDIKRFRELQKNTQGNRKEFVKLGRSLDEAGYNLKDLLKKQMKVLKLVGSLYFLKIENSIFTFSKSSSIF